MTIKQPTPIKPGVVQAGQPDPLVVALLEKYLALAKSGHIVSVGIAVSSDNNSITDWAGSREVMSLLGAISLLHYRLNAATHAWSSEFN